VYFLRSVILQQMLAIHVYICYISQVLDLLEDACEGLLSHIESKKFATES